MFSVASVCLSVCQHDNFLTIKRGMMKLGGYVHCTKILPEFEYLGQRSRSPGQKTKKCSILFRSCSMGRGPRAAFFLEGAPSLVALLRRWENQRMLSSFFFVSQKLDTSAWFLLLVECRLLTPSLVTLHASYEIYTQSVTHCKPRSEPVQLFACFFFL